MCATRKKRVATTGLTRKRTNHAPTVEAGRHGAAKGLEEGFELDEASQEELLAADRAIRRGEYISSEELFRRLKRLK